MEFCRFSWIVYSDADTFFIGSDKRVDLVPLISSPSWQFDQENLWRLPGAHGEEVVRSVYLDEQVCSIAISFWLSQLANLVLQNQTVFTGGEDGLVRAWKPADGGDFRPQGGLAKASRPKEKKQKERFKPY